MNELVELPRAKCEELLRASIVGRVGYTTEHGPRIVPVNYSTVGDAVVFRTTPYSELAANVDGHVLAFEVDHIDYDDHTGWSVLAVGVGEHLASTDELRDAATFWDPKPWAQGARVLYVRIPWTQLTGRRIGAGWTRDKELPVRRR